MCKSLNKNQVRQIVLNPYYFKTTVILQCIYFFPVLYCLFGNFFLYISANLPTLCGIGETCNSHKDCEKVITNSTCNNISGVCECETGHIHLLEINTCKKGKRKCIFSFIINHKKLVHFSFSNQCFSYYCNHTQHNF